MGLKWDPTISFGTVLAIAAVVTSIVGGWFAFRQFMMVELAKMTATLRNHAEQLEQNASELRDQRAANTKLIGEVQRLVGQMELLLRMQDRRASER